VSEVTTLICAHCGVQNTVNNRKESDGTVTIIYYGNSLAMSFRCQHCGVQYPLVKPGLCYPVDRLESVKEPKP
jgi:hypothetical protein